METGKLAQRVAAAANHEREVRQLELEVCRAARVWYDNGDGDTIEGSPLADAVRALITFESEHKRARAASSAPVLSNYPVVSEAKRESGQRMEPSGESGHAHKH